MNEREMSTLLDRATRDLVPDVEALAAGGLRRGRARRRRRRAAGAAATAVAAVLVVGVGWQALGAGGADTRGIDPADQGPPAVAPPPPTRATLAVTTAQVPATFASLEPGEVSAPGAKSGPDAAPVVDFTWDGFGIRVGLTPDDASGRSVPDPARRCAEEGAEGGAVSACRPGPGGTVVQTWSATNPEVDGGTSERGVWVFRPDGWDVLVVAYDGPGKEGPVIADQPPFSLEELRRIATSDVWFR